MTPRLHPFGDPQTVDIGSADGAVHVQWKVGAADDLTLLGIELGVLPEDRVLLDGAIMFEAGDGDAVAASDELHDYLLEHVAVTAGGKACAGEVTGVGDLVEEGASLAFACPERSGSATVQVSTLTDLHPAYRTLATGPDGQRAVYAGGDDTHDWALPVEASRDARPGEIDQQSTAAQADPGSDLGENAALQMGAVGAVLLILAAGAVAARRRMQRSTPQPTPRRS